MDWIYQWGSSSLPDVTAISGGVDCPFPMDGISPGLPRLHTLPKGASMSPTCMIFFLNSKMCPMIPQAPRNSSISGKYALHASPAKRTSSLIRPTSPKSPVPSASTFESMEGSDDEDNLTDSTEITNIGNGEQLPIPASMIRSHSVSGDLHGVHADPIAADILRKEPEQETFACLKIALTKVPSPDEVEVYVVLQECLEMRNRYPFKEAVAPWQKEVISDPSTPKPNPEPFFYFSEGKSDHYFEMQDGVIHVYPNTDSREELFPVADATTFFTNLHHILRVITVGNIRTLCHHRLNLLEQKFNLHLMLNADREFLAQKSAPHCYFYNVRKVDTHVHHFACMNQKHLLRFIKSKLRKEPDKVVIFRDGTYLTLKEVFESLDLTGTFHRFDKFNLKYNTCGQSRLREIFLKQDNLIQGCFLAEPTKQVFTGLEASKYQYLFFFYFDNILYEALIAGLNLAKDMGIKKLSIRSDSQLFASALPRFPTFHPSSSDPSSFHGPSWSGEWTLWESFLQHPTNACTCLQSETTSPSGWKRRPTIRSVHILQDIPTCKFSPYLVNDQAVASIHPTSIHHALHYRKFSHPIFTPSSSSSLSNAAHLQPAQPFFSSNSCHVCSLTISPLDSALLNSRPAQMTNFQWPGIPPGPDGPHMRSTLTKRAPHPTRSRPRVVYQGSQVTSTPSKC
ncbi:hypothetical protein UlMin_028394 [Ulmus minor]